jgi:hypothetical protein
MKLTSSIFEYSSYIKEEDNGSRRYVTPTGKLPSVTTILGATKPEATRHILESWRNAIGNYMADQITYEASCRGTRVHKYLENYILTGEFKPPGNNPYAKEAHMMAGKIIDYGLMNVDAYWGAEVELYFPGIYAGTTDLVGTHIGMPTIMDFKQSNRIKPDDQVEDYKLQLVAYSEAHNELYNTNIQKGVILLSVRPEQPRPGVFQYPRYQEWILEGNEYNKYKTLWWKRVEEYYLLDQ